jgi:KDO2-lipid IV(A) lauroyltransferase
LWLAWNALAAGVSGSEALDVRDPRATAKYLTYRGLGTAMSKMPEPLAMGVARTVAFAMSLRSGPGTPFAMSERHMRRVLASECTDGIEPDPALVRRLARRTFREYARYWADGARLPNVSHDGVRAQFRLISGREHLDAARALGRGYVMALPHVGSWEWGGAWLALEGFPMTAVMERLEPPELFAWFSAQRVAMGLTPVPMGEGSSAAMLRAIKAGEIAGLVSDRDMVGNGVEVSFFGEKTTLPGGAATLALRTGAPLLPVVVYSGPGNGHTAEVHAPLDTTRSGSLRDDVARITQELASVFEGYIRRHPEQWHLYQPNWPSDTAIDSAVPVRAP